MSYENYKSWLIEIETVEKNGISRYTILTYKRKGEKNDKN